jgi:hypothetical protein
MKVIQNENQEERKGLHLEMKLSDNGCGFYLLKYL